MFRTIALMAFSVLISACANSPKDKPSPTSEASVPSKQSGYFEDGKGLKMYYEVQGQGEPIVLLHGSYLTIDLNWRDLMPALAKTRQVIAVEMQGHGRTADFQRPYSYKTLADDIAGLLTHLKIPHADILGYSFGGTVAYQMAISHPTRVDKLIIVSSVFKYTGWIKDNQKMFRQVTPEFFEKTPIKTDYDRLAVDKTQWKSWMKKMIRFDGTPYDLGAQKIRAIQSPVLLIMGDNDGVDLAHVKEMYEAVGGGVSADMKGLPKSQLAVFPATTHVTLMSKTDQLVSTIVPFLDRETAPAK